MAFTNSKISQYAQNDTKVNVFEASPHRLVQMLMEGAIEKINFAKGYMDHGNIPEKGRHISWAISIVDGLRASIDKEAGGEIAQNLDDLYDYMGRRLLQSNIENDASILVEVANLMREVKGAWDVVPDEVKGLRARQEADSVNNNLIHAGA